MFAIKWNSTERRKEGTHSSTSKDEGLLKFLSLLGSHPLGQYAMPESSIGDGVRVPNLGLARDVTSVKFHGSADQPESSGNIMAWCLTLFLNRLLGCFENEHGSDVADLDLLHTLEIASALLVRCCAVLSN